MGACTLVSVDQRQVTSPALKKLGRTSNRQESLHDTLLVSCPSQYVSPLVRANLRRADSWDLGALESSKHYSSRRHPHLKGCCLAWLLHARYQTQSSSGVGPDLPTISPYPRDGSCAMPAIELIAVLPRHVTDSRHCSSLRFEPSFDPGFNYMFERRFKSGPRRRPTRTRGDKDALWSRDPLVHPCATSVHLDHLLLLALSASKPLDRLASAPARISAPFPGQRRVGAASRGTVKKTLPGPKRSTDPNVGSGIPAFHPPGRYHHAPVCCLRAKRRKP